MDEVVEYDLKYSIPDNVGLQFSGRGRARELIIEDVPELLKSIFKKVDAEKSKTGKESVSLRVKGIASKPVLMKLTWGISKRADIKNFYYTEPYGLGCIIGEGGRCE